MMTLRPNTKSQEAFKLGWFKTTFPYRAACYMWCTKAYAGRHGGTANPDMYEFPDTKARYVYGEINTRDLPVLRKLQGLGLFQDLVLDGSTQRQFYTFIQYGNTDSPLIFACWKCRSMNEAALIAKGRADRKMTIKKIDRDTLKARIAVLGMAKDIEEPAPEASHDHGED